MSLRSDFARFQKQNLRRRHRIAGELSLRKGAAASHDDDLAVSVMTNRARTLQREKIDRLRRHR